MGMKDVAVERLKILEVMNEVTHKVGLKEFTGMAGMSLGKTLGYLQGLVNTGFVKKVGKRYSITQEGRIALKLLRHVPDGKEFQFYAGVGQQVGLSAKSFEEFCEIVKRVDVRALEFHVTRGDFENWVLEIFEDTELANEFSRIRESKSMTDQLRSEILRATESRHLVFEKLRSS
jgi:hypothetical protein